MKIPTLGDAGKILDKRIEQIVKIAGDGRLIDGGETTKEFREFLANVPDSTYLGRYVNECLQQPFESSGLVLQDLINEVGKRLGFKVEHGRYAGTKKELGERLEKIRERHEQGMLNSLEFLKAILEIAKELVEVERRVEPQEEQNRAIAALTDLFNEAKNGDTNVIVERVVEDIDRIVKTVRFDGWQNTAQGEREVKQALRRALLKYKLHTDQGLFDRAYGYIEQYY